MLNRRAPSAAPFNRRTDERRASADERRFPECHGLLIIPTVHCFHTITRSSRRRVCGFTLIELMIALVVVGVLLSLALPSLMGSIRKSRRAEAFTKLNAVQLAQERFRANNPDYAASLSLLSLQASTPDGRYTLAAVAPGASAPVAASYGVVATPVSGSSQVDDGNCAQLRLRVEAGNTYYEAAPAGGTPTQEMGRACWVR